MNRWLFLWLSFGALFLLSPLQAQAEPWHARALVGIETGPTGAQFGSDAADIGYAARFNGRDCVQRAVAALCDYIVIWARDGAYAYYDSILQPKAPGLGERDVLREAVEEAEKHDLPVIAYCVLQYPTHTLHAHPEWRMRDKDGNPIDRVCFNSPYLEHVKELLAEMMAYDIDGFHLDMVDQGFGPPYGCWCDHCHEKFRAEHGRDMPDGVTWDAAWDAMLAFRYASSARFEKALEDYVKDAAPDLSVDFNYHGNPPFSWEVGQRPVQHGVTGDFITGETGLWAFSALGVGLNAAFYRATAPDRRVQVVMQRGVRHYHDQTTRPTNDLRWEAMTLLAHGAFVTMVDKTAYDGWLDPVFYERLRKVFGEAQAKREHFGQPVHADVGLWFSHRTRDWLGRESVAQAWQGFLGAHQAMVYAHVPWAVILDENAGVERLRAFPVILLPNVGILSEEEVANLSQYVEDGGQLIVTGQSGLFDLYGQPREESALEKLIGARVLRRLDSVDNHVRFHESEHGSPVAASIPVGWPFLVQGRGVVYKATTAEVVGQLWQPHRTVPQREGQEGVVFPMSADTPVGPAILVHEFGKGRVVTFACSPGEAVAGEFGISEARRLLVNAVKHLVGTPLVSVHAPQFVESVVTRDPADDTLRVHLIARPAPPSPTPPADRPFVLPEMLEDTPLFRVEIEVPRGLRSARAINETTVLEIGKTELRALVEDVHEVIIVEQR